MSIDTDKPNAQDFLNRMYNACISNYSNLFIVENAYYGGIEGHKRLARNIGECLPDFDEKNQKDIMGGSYSFIYVRICNLKPLIDAKVWVTEILKGKDSMLELKERQRLLLNEFSLGS
jgi:hypothetical protein